MRRVRLFIPITFAVTWICWWALAWFTASGRTEFGSPFSMVLFILGGSGPTVAAYLSAARTPEEGSLKEFHSRVLAWRASWVWKAYALLLPLVLGLVIISAAQAADSGFLQRNPLRPPYLFIPLFFTSIVMGGLEEFGWRGVMQESLKDRFSLPALNLIIGLTWALWHLPLFFTTGLAHQGSSFLFYTLSAVGYSAMLTRLYASTRSILLCVIFHASINASGGIGASVPLGEAGLLPLQSAVLLLAGTVILLTSRRGRHLSC